MGIALTRDTAREGGEGVGGVLLLRFLLQKAARQSLCMGEHIMYGA